MPNTFQDLKSYGPVKRQMRYSVLFYGAELESSIASHEEIQNRWKLSDENYPWVDQVSWSKKQFIPEHVPVKLHIKEGVEGAPELSRKLD